MESVNCASVLLSICHQNLHLLQQRLVLVLLGMLFASTSSALCLNTDIAVHAHDNASHTRLILIATAAACLTFSADAVRAQQTLHRMGNPDHNFSSAYPQKQTVISTNMITHQTAPVILALERAKQASLMQQRAAELEQRISSFTQISESKKSPVMSSVYESIKLHTFPAPANYHREIIPEQRLQEPTNEATWIALERRSSLRGKKPGLSLQPSMPERISSSSTYSVDTAGNEYSSNSSPQRSSTASMYDARSLYRNTTTSETIDNSQSMSDHGLGSNIQSNSHNLNHRSGNMSGNPAEACEKLQRHSLLEAKTKIIDELLATALSSGTAVLASRGHPAALGLGGYHESGWSPIQSPVVPTVIPYMEISEAAQPTFTPVKIAFIALGVIAAVTLSVLMFFLLYSRRRKGRR